MTEERNRLEAILEAMGDGVLVTDGEGKVVLVNPALRAMIDLPPDPVGRTVIELVRNRATMEPMAPFNGTSPEMQALGKFFRQEGLYTFVRWNTFFTNPPLCITEDELREAFAIIDRGLEITDRAVVA